MSILNGICLVVAVVCLTAGAAMSSPAFALLGMVIGALGAITCTRALMKGHEQ